MRLDKLSIASFKNVRDFELDFDEESPTTVLVGRNGSGKSNLLEALILIFRNLDLGEPPPFKYELNYDCRGSHLDIVADPDKTRAEQLNIKVDDLSITYKKFMEGRKYLPNFVFGYYSGPSNRMEQHFLKHQQRFYDALIKPKGEDEPLRPLFYARLVHSQFVLLAFFNDQEKEIQRFLKENLWIEGLDSVLFVMKQPSWPSNQGDPRFWNARGTAAEFLSELYDRSLAPLRFDQRVKVDFRRSTTLEHLYLYLKDSKTLRSLAGVYPSQQEFFKALESTYISELISEVRIKVKVRNLDGSLTFRELSEGEQQLLMVLGLLRFTQEDESLFLLDEPDTHLNPAWSLRYLEFIKLVVGDQPNSHILMTTHDPLTIAGLTRSQVQVMQRDDGTGQISAKYAAEDPRGMGVAALLTSDIYGLRSTLDLETLNLLDKKRELSIKETLTPEERDQLAQLNQQLDGLDFSSEIRDPLYGQFVRKMTEIEKEQELQVPVLTEAQREKRDEIAEEVLREILAKESKEP